jgi:hypothetical protein
LVAALEENVLSVVPIKSEPRCKICNSTDRPELDELLLQRSRRHRLEDGSYVTEKVVLARMAELGIANPTVDNLRLHWKRHCEVVSRKHQEERDEEALKLLDGLSAEDLLGMNRQQLVDLLMRQGIAEARVRASQTGKSGITMDHVLRLVELQIKEKGSEDQRRFLEAIGGGIARALGPGVPHLPAGEVIEAEVVEVEV